MPTAYMSLANDTLPASKLVLSVISNSGAIHLSVPRAEDVPDSEKVPVFCSSVVRPKSARQAFIWALTRMFA